MTLLMVNASVTSAADGNQVAQVVVPNLPVCGNAETVDMVNVKVGSASASLASVAIPLQSFLSISAKRIVVLCYYDVLFGLGWVVFKPLVNLSYSMRPLTVRTAMLWASRIGKSSSTHRASFCGANSGYSSAFPKFPLVGDVLLGTVRANAICADFLARRGWLVSLAASFARFFAYSVTSFAMSSKRTWAAAFLGWAGFVKGVTAPKTDKSSVFTHDGLNMKLMPSLYSMGY